MGKLASGHEITRVYEHHHTTTNARTRLHRTEVRSVSSRPSLAHSVSSYFAGPVGELDSLKSLEGQRRSISARIALVLRREGAKTKFPIPRSSIVRTNRTLGPNDHLLQRCTTIRSISFQRRSVVGTSHRNIRVDASNRTPDSDSTRRATGPLKRVMPTTPPPKYPAPIVTSPKSLSRRSQRLR